MTAEAKKVLDDALSLTDAERRHVAEALLSSVPLETADDIESAWLEQARHRAGKLERGEVQARDGDEALAGLEAKLRSMHAR